VDEKLIRLKNNSTENNENISYFDFVVLLEFKLCSSNPSLALLHILTCNWIRIITTC